METKLEEYGKDIEYIKGEKNIEADKISRSALNGNEDTTKKYNYQKEIVADINDIKEIPEGTLHINLKVIQKYQRGNLS